MPERIDLLPVGTRIIVRKDRADTEGTIIEHILIEEKKPKYLVKFNDGASLILSFNDDFKVLA